jgi:hypothetical protein
MAQHRPQILIFGEFHPEIARRRRKARLLSRGSLVRVQPGAPLLARNRESDVMRARIRAVNSPRIIVLTGR